MKLFKLYKYNIYIVILLGIIVINLLINYPQKYKEGLTIPGLDEMVNGFEKVSDIATQIPKEISGIKNDINGGLDTVKNATNKITNEIDNKLNNFLKEVENLVVKKFKSFFTQFGDILYKGLINPIVILFEGIGSIFTFIFEILKEIINKIISLPKCIIIYVISSLIDIFYNIYASIIPKFIRTNLEYIINPPLDWFLNIIGYTNARHNCYKFEVRKEILSI